MSDKKTKEITCLKPVRTRVKVISATDLDKAKLGSVLAIVHNDAKGGTFTALIVDMGTCGVHSVVKGSRATFTDFAGRFQSVGWTMVSVASDPTIADLPYPIEKKGPKPGGGGGFGYPPPPFLELVQALDTVVSAVRDRG